MEKHQETETVGRRSPMLMLPPQTSRGASWAFYLRGLAIPEGSVSQLRGPGEKNASSTSLLLPLPEPWEPARLQKQDTQVTNSLLRCG